jgi:hypothetical protein
LLRLVSTVMGSALLGMAGSPLVQWLGTPPISEHEELAKELNRCERVKQARFLADLCCEIPARSDPAFEFQSTFEGRRADDSLGSNCAPGSATDRKELERTDGVPSE